MISKLLITGNSRSEIRNIKRGVAMCVQVLAPRGKGPSISARTRYVLVRGLVLLAIALSLVGFDAQPSFAATPQFPNKVVKIIVGFGPGGSSDVAARLIAERLADEWKQPVIVENKPGAGTTIAAAHVASSTPDGYTLLLISPGTHSTSGALYKNLSYDAVKSFAGIGLIATAPFVVVVPETSPIKSFKDLIERAQANPGKLTYSTGGAGTGPHLVAEVISQATGAQFLHVPFKASAEATSAVLAQHVDFSIAEASASALVKSGRMRGLAVTTSTQSDLFKGIPTVAESAIAQFSYPLSIGLAAPARTPPDVIAKINESLNRALANEATRSSLINLGFEPRTESSQKFDERLAGEAVKYRKIVNDIGLKIN
jgi:tripartite-type tricarboxylate transporter receptor subunit TctC